MGTDATSPRDVTSRGDTDMQSRCSSRRWRFARGRRSLLAPGYSRLRTELTQRYRGRSTAGRIRYPASGQYPAERSLTIETEDGPVTVGGSGATKEADECLKITIDGLQTNNAASKPLYYAKIGVRPTVATGRCDWPCSRRDAGSTRSNRCSISS